nr:hypothetical protein [Tanacetum cinerariifolium]
MHYFLRDLPVRDDYLLSFTLDIQRMSRSYTSPFDFRRFVDYSPSDVLNCVFLASRLQSPGLQTKLLWPTSIIASRPNFDDALSVFNKSIETDFLSNPNEIAAHGKEVDTELDGGHDKPLCPADMLLYSWDEGLDECMDLTRSSPLTQTELVDFVPGQTVIDDAQRKRGKYTDKCAPIRYGFSYFLSHPEGNMRQTRLSY